MTSASLSGGQVRWLPLNKRASLLIRRDRLLRPITLPVTATKRPCYRDKQEGPFGASNLLISRAKSRIMAPTCAESACFRADSSKNSLFLRNNRDTGPKPNCLSSYRRTPEAKASLASMNSPLFRALVGLRRVKGADGARLRRSLFDRELCWGWLAERVGFEPTVSLRPRRISSAVLSTSQPPLRRGRGPGTGPGRGSGARPLAKSFLLAKRFARLRHRATWTLASHGLSCLP
jgi:hypothetical protein